MTPDGMWLVSIAVMWGGYDERRTMLGALNHLQKVTRCVTFRARFSDDESRHPT